jgi:protein involved in polysaccharide export with SLBB domain
MVHPVSAAEPPEPTAAGGAGARLPALAAGDTIAVEVGGPTGLAGSFALAADGTFAMPGVGTVEAWGESPEAVATMLSDALGRGGGERPEVRVRLVEPRPIYVLGAVDRPGHYAYQAGMTVADALDAAGAESHGLADGRVRLRAGGSNVRPVPAHLATALLPGDVVEVSSP